MGDYHTGAGRARPLGILLALAAACAAPAVAEGAEVMHGERVDVALSMDPAVPGQRSVLVVGFADPITGEPLHGIDYSIHVRGEDSDILGPIPNVHARGGSSRIPVSLDAPGGYDVRITVSVISSERIPEETAGFRILVDGDGPRVAAAQVDPHTGTAGAAGTHTVYIQEGSSVPGCQEADACFVPAGITINVGETVTWRNGDSTPHTVMSGSVAAGPTGYFGSGLFLAGAGYSHTFDEPGTYDYFDAVHPWMSGTVTVAGDGAAAIPDPAPGAAATHTVQIPPGTGAPGCEEADACFKPPEISIGVGDTVTWENGDATPHTVLAHVIGSLPPLFESGLIPAGSGYSFTFEDPGRHGYYCIIHPWMSGTVVAKGERTEREAGPNAAEEVPVTIQPKIIRPNTVYIPEGSDVAGCEEEEMCYVPARITINAGETITWENRDSAPHTVMSGSVASGPTGDFGSGLFLAGAGYSHTFEEPGTYDYFCLVHPWRTGTVTVS